MTSTVTPTSSTTIAYAGGGTGGHIYPAIAIAQALARTHPDSRHLFIHSTRPIDAAVLKDHPLHAPIPAQPFSIHPRKLPRFALNYRAATARAAQLLDEHAPAALVITGGFVGPPAHRAARKQRIPTLLINLDAVPGKANRLMARHASAVLSASPGPAIPDHWSVVPPIVRDEAINTDSPQGCRQRLGLDPDLPTLLVMGGSQGATSINHLMAELAEPIQRELEHSHTRWQVLHLAGLNRTGKPRAAYDAASLRAAVLELLPDMATAWGAATLALCRAGAGTVAEAWANRTPCLFLPYPHHKDNHQAHNAAPLVSVGGAQLFTDHVDPKKNAGYVGRRLLELVETPDALDAMRSRLDLLGPADGADRAASVLRQLLDD